MPMGLRKPGAPPLHLSVDRVLIPHTSVLDTLGGTFLLGMGPRVFWVSVK